jgi:serine/threonine-protein kinase
MSPEQVIGQPVDGRSDLFGVGVVLAEMLMGRRLFTAPNDLDVLLMVRDARIERLDKYCPDLPPALGRIVRRALKKDLGERYATAVEFHDDLADYLYSTGQRVGAPDLRGFVGDLFDTSPEAAARLAQRVRRIQHPRAQERPLAAAAAGDGQGLDADGGGERHTDVVSTSRIVEAVALDGDALSESPTASMPRGPVTGVDDSWPSDEDQERSSVRGFTPVSRPGAERPRPPAAARNRRPGTDSDVGRFVSGAPKRPPDSAGDISVITPMRLFCDLAVAGETGLLRFEVAGVVKEIFLVGGAPESVSSSLRSERFGEFLVGKGVLGAGDLDLALSMLPSYNGKLGDTLVALGLLRPLDVFRLLSQQVRDRVIDVFGWTEGTFAFYRGITNPHDSFPLGLDTFEILGVGVANLSAELLEPRFGSQLDYRPIATGRVRVAPEAFRLGPTPREVLDMLDGERTVRAWMEQFTNRDELLTFLRSLYLLIETDLAQLD